MKDANMGDWYLLIFKSGYASAGFNKLFSVIMLILFLGLSEMQAQQAMDYTIQANIIYRFTKYIEWPENKKSGDFIIGIIGESPLTDELKNFIVNKTAGSQKITIKLFSASAESYNCHILFIAEDESGFLKRIVMRTAGSPVLIVTESDGLAKRGACINFINVTDHLKLEINRNNIEGRNLSIASELLQLGIIVK